MKSKLLILFLFGGIGLNAQFANLKPAPKAEDCGCIVYSTQKVTTAKDGKKTYKEGTTTMYQDAFIISIGTAVKQFMLDKYPYYYDEKGDLYKLHWNDLGGVISVGSTLYVIKK